MADLCEIGEGLRRRGAIMGGLVPKTAHDQAFCVTGMMAGAVFLENATGL